MLRQASSHFLTPSILPRRFISTSSHLSKGSRGKNSLPSTPSPAERPPPPPPTSSTSTYPQPIEPIINQPSPFPSTQPLASPDLPRAIPPLTPPAPTAESIEDDNDFSKLPSLNIDPEAALPAPGGRGSGGRTGAKEKEYVTSSERSRRRTARLGLLTLGLGSAGAIWWALQKDGPMVQGQGEKQGVLDQIKGNLSELFDYFNKPAFKLLLPDPLPAPHQRPYTLLVDLEGMLVSSSWDRTLGWKTAKRPGVDYFLAYLSQFYEIVLFTSQPLYTALPVSEKLDPFQAYLPYKLFRDSTRTVGGKTVKDLTYLNRDLSKVILLDTNPEHAALQPDNSIIIQPWERKGNDQGLVELIPFLESIGFFSPADVRPILKAYQGKDIPTEYAKKEAEAKRIAVAEWDRLHPTSLHGAGSGLLSGLFGSVAAPGQSRPNQPMTYVEQKRIQAQRIYQEEQKYWADHAEEFKKLIEEDKQKQMEGMRGNLLGLLTGQQAAPPPGQSQEGGK